MNLLVTGAWQQAKDYIEIIEKQGHQVVFLQYEKDELPCEYSWVEGIIGNGIFLSHPIERFTKLKYIQITSAGFDRVPMDYVKDHGIVINNARGVYSTPMAEYALAGVLSLYKSQKFFIDKQKTHKWEKKRNLRELAGQKVCILGCGSVGTECARKFKAMDCIVYGVDVNVTENENYYQIYHLNDIKNVISKSDIVIVTLPLTDKTRHMFNKEMFEKMKFAAVLVNIARGALIETDALIKALEHKLYGAVLDVFEEEPLDNNSPLWDMDNVVVTPHNSFVGEGNEHRLSNTIKCNIERYTL